MIGDVTANCTRPATTERDLFVRLCDVDPPVALRPQSPATGRSTPAKDFVVTHYSIQSSSALVISQATGKEAAHV